MKPWLVTNLPVCLQTHLLQYAPLLLSINTGGPREFVTTRDTKEDYHPDVLSCAPQWDKAKLDQKDYLGRCLPTPSQCFSSSPAPATLLLITCARLEGWTSFVMTTLTPLFILSLSPFLGSLLSFSLSMLYSQSSCLPSQQATCFLFSVSRVFSRGLWFYLKPCSSVGKLSSRT